MNNIYFYLTAIDNVRFILPGKMTTYSSMPYKKFIVYLKRNFKTNDYKELLDRLNTYGNTILLNGGNGEWVVRNESFSEENKNLTFEELYELNKETEKEKSKIDQLFESSKNFIKRIYNDGKKH